MKLKNDIAIAISDSDSDSDNDSDSDSDSDSDGNNIYYEILNETVESLLNVFDITTINFQNNIGETALFCAVKKGNVDIVRQLVNKGADTTIPDNNGTLPIDIALQLKIRRILT